MRECSLESSVPDWIIDHPETTMVFQKLGIDTCCGGKSLEYLCQIQGLDQDILLLKLVETIKST